MNSHCKFQEWGFDDGFKSETAACHDHLAQSYLLDRLYTSPDTTKDSQHCNPTDHDLPTLQRHNFIKTCAFPTNISIIYFIVAHKHPNMLQRLLNRLSEDTSFLLLVHIDEHATEAFSNEVKRLVQAPNRCLVRYGSIVYFTASILEAMTAAFKWALKANTQWSHLITLTGQDYPLFHPHTIRKRVLEVGNFTWYPDFSTCIESDFCRCVQNPSSHPEFHRMKTFGFPCANKTLKFAVTLPRNPWIFSNHADYKLDYFCKTYPMTSAVWARRTVHYLTHDPIAIASYAFFHRSYCAVEEHFWPSLLWSKVREHLHIQTPCMMSWDIGVGEGGTKASIDNTHNTFLTMNEKEFILTAHKYGSLFARKFSVEFDSAILDYIDSLVG